MGEGGAGWSSSLLPLGLLSALQPSLGTSLPSVVSGLLHKSLSMTSGQIWRSRNQTLRLQENAADPAEVLLALTDFRVS